MIIRQHIDTASKLYKMKGFVESRRKVSPETYDTVVALLKGYSEKEGKPILESAIELATKEEGYYVLWLLGTAAILIEEDKENIMELTEQIAGSYLGCFAQFNDSRLHPANRIHRTTGVVDFKLHYGNGGWLQVNHCQLILTSLENISDADAIEVAKIGGIDSGKDDTYKIHQGKELVCHYRNKVSNVCASTWVEIIDYLRSKGYDYGFMNIPSLIEVGIAITAPTPERSVAENPSSEKK